MKSKHTLVTRRSLAGLLAAPLASPQALAPQTPAATKDSSALQGARAEYSSAAEALAKVKMPRFVEPVTRFEA